jgi:hypothetical protein
MADEDRVAAVVSGLARDGTAARIQDCNGKESVVPFAGLLVPVAESLADVTTADTAPPKQTALDARRLVTLTAAIDAMVEGAVVKGEGGNTNLLLATFGPSGPVEVEDILDEGVRQIRSAIVTLSEHAEHLAGRTLYALARQGTPAAIPPAPPSGETYPPITSSGPVRWAHVHELLVRASAEVARVQDEAATITVDGREVKAADPVCATNVAAAVRKALDEWRELADTSVEHAILEAGTREGGVL